MEAKKSARQKSSSKKEFVPSPQSEESKDFVEKMKKKAIVKTHGIDNVRYCHS
jgi:hypothetical protein